jgi:DNA (cytosine-5)-methyltransferase 1
MRGLSLFSGVGAFDLALEPWVDFAYGCDIDRWVAALYERRLRRPCLPDVHEIDAGCGPFEVLAGGFPCQPVSQAGKGLAQDDERWLWPEFRRLIALFEPGYVFIENVPGLRRRGLIDVLRDLHELGYRASWDGIPAAAVGAPHLRDRIWIVAYREERWTAPIFGETLEMFGRPLEEAAGMRAGILDEDGLVHPTEPVAPVKTERRDGWSYWTGVQLGGSAGSALWPTPAARDWKDRGANVDWENRARNGGLSLPFAVNSGPLYPTPKAVRYGSSQNGLNGVNGEKRRPSAGTPSLDTIAARGLWPTPKSSPSGPDFARAGREQSGGDDLATAVYRNEKGPLNPDWVEWLMGLPCGWTDPEREPEPLRGWHEEPLPRVLRDVPMRRERLQACGNALVWQIPRLVARQAFGITVDERSAA